MRQDQFERLATLSDKLTEVVLEETDPSTWPGDGKKLAELSREDRGDRYWCKKNAAATLSLLTRVHVITNMVLRAGADVKPEEPKDEEDDLDTMISKAERDAAAIIEKAARGRAN